MTLIGTVCLIAAALTILAILIGGIAFILRWVFDISLRLKMVEEEIKKIPSTVKVAINETLSPILAPAIAQLLGKTNPLAPEEIRVKNELLKKLAMKNITLQEAERLEEILMKEKEDAEQKNDWGVLFAIGIVLSAIALLHWASKEEATSKGKNLSPM